MGALCPACLVLHPPDFPEPEDEPPTILSTEPSSADLQVVDRTQSEPVEFVVHVFDANEEDVLSAQAFVDWAIDADSAGSIDIVAADDEDARHRVVTASLRPGRDFAQRGCHVVEIDVIDDASGWIDERTVEADVGKVTATWFVLAHDGDGYEDISLASCPGADRGAGQP